MCVACVGTPLVAGRGHSRPLAPRADQVQGLEGSGHGDEQGSKQPRELAKRQGWKLGGLKKAER